MNLHQYRWKIIKRQLCDGVIINLPSIRGEVHEGFWWENLREGDHMDLQEVG